MYRLPYLIISLSLCFPPKELHFTAPVAAYDMRKVELIPLEQRKLTFDSHAMVIELENNGRLRQSLN